MNIPKKARQILCLVAASTAFFSATASNNQATKGTDTFTGEQKKAIEHIVHDYLVNQPEVLVDAPRTLQQHQQQAIANKAQGAIAQNANAIFNSSSPSSGNPKADVTIVEFFDYQCIHCKEMKPVLHDLLNSDKNIRVVYKDFPIFGQGSQYASLAALAAAKQGKYVELYGALMKTRQPVNKATVLGLAKGLGIDMAKLKTDIDSADVKEQLKNNAQLAETLGLGGTPAFIIAKTNGSEVKKSFFVPGSVSGAMLQNFIEQARKA